LILSLWRGHLGQIPNEAWVGLYEVGSGFCNIQAGQFDNVLIRAIARLSTCITASWATKPHGLWFGNALMLT
jgi:hypothetical protein